MILDFESELALLEKDISSQKIAVLATSLNDDISIRSMSIVFIDHKIYFQTDLRMKKYKQILGNSNVALNVGTIAVEGQANILGKANEQNVFVDIFSKIHPGSFKKYSNLNTEIAIAVTIEKIKIWLYIDEKPFEKIFNIQQKTVELIEFS